MSSVDRKIFSKRFNQALLRRGLTPASFANNLGISRQSASAYARGESAPTPENLLRIAKILDVSEGWLTGLEGNQSEAMEGVKPMNEVSPDYHPSQRHEGAFHLPLDDIEVAKIGRLAGRINVSKETLIAQAVKMFGEETVRRIKEEHGEDRAFLKRRVKEDEG